MASRPTLPAAVPNLLRQFASLDLTEIATELSHGSLHSIVTSLDEMSLEIGAQVADELRSEHEGLGLFKEAAALDLLKDRLQDEQARR